MRIRNILQNAYSKWRNNDYIFEKKSENFEPISFGELIENSVFLAESLLKMNLKGKKIMIFGNNSINWMTADLAVMGFVGISVSVDKEWKIDDVKNTIQFLDIDAVIFSEEKSEIINAVRELFDIPFICMESDFPNLILEGKTLNNSRDNMLDFEERNADECVKVVFSSGTVSSPKAVMLSEKNILFGWESLYKRAPMDENDICYLFLPLHHTYAGIYNFIYSLISGMKIYLCSGISNIASELASVQPTVFCGVPLIYKRFYEAVSGNCNALFGIFGSRIKYLFCGGAYLDENIRMDYKRSGLNLLIAYALSETASSFSIEYSNSKNYKSVGTIFEDIDAKILNPNEKGEGEIAVKGGNVFLGYMNNAKATSDAFDENGYFKTGDNGYIVGNELYFLGRKDRVIVMENGENIYPKNIESRILAKSENINSVKVYQKSNFLKANIYLKKHDKADYSAIISSVNDEATKFERISEFEVFVDSVDSRMKQ